MYDVQAHQRYNKRNTNSLPVYLKRLGLEYQSITGCWLGDIEKSFLVWNTAYAWEQFQQIMLKLNKLYKQRGICIGRKVDDKYDIYLLETDDLNSILYKVSRTFTTANVTDALRQFGTVFTRDEIAPDKVQDTIKFEALQKNVCAASAECLMGAYNRNSLIKSLMAATSIETLNFN